MSIPSPRFRIGLDLGGTKIEAVLLTPDGRFGQRIRIATPTNATNLTNAYDDTLRAIRDLVARLENDLPERARIGICTPGSIAPDSNLMRNCNSTHLNGKPLIRDLEALLKRPIRSANDADCFTLSEAIDGAAHGAALVFGVIMGTGVGGGFTMDGRLLGGPNRIAGEWGHTPLPSPTREESKIAPLCYCGLKGCLETWISGPALSVDHLHHEGENCDATEIAQRAQNEDPGCRRSLQRHHHRSARGLAVVINIVDPDMIVLGGGLSNISSLYDDLPGLIEAYAFTSGLRTRIVPNAHGDSSGVRGAARLWPDQDTPPLGEPQSP